MHVGLVRKCLRSWEPQHRQSSPKGNPQNLGGRGRGMGAVFSRKPAISLKRSNIEPRLLVMTNRKSHTRLRLVPKSTTLDDTERPLRKKNKKAVLSQAVLFGLKFANGIHYKFIE